jgi:hypothetical protein
LQNETWNSITSNLLWACKFETGMRTVSLVFSIKQLNKLCYEILWLIYQMPIQYNSTLIIRIVHNKWKRVISVWCSSFHTQNKQLERHLPERPRYKFLIYFYSKHIIIVLPQNLLMSSVGVRSWFMEKKKKECILQWVSKFFADAGSISIRSFECKGNGWLMRSTQKWDSRKFTAKMAASLAKLKIEFWTMQMVFNVEIPLIVIRLESVKVHIPKVNCTF